MTPLETAIRANVAESYEIEFIDEIMEIIMETIGQFQITHTTSDYSVFKMIQSNRDLDITHVKRLMRSLKVKNLLHLRPAIVTPELQPIDGQHRIAACERLGIPVHYIIDHDVTKDDMALLNTAQKNWTTMDFINYFTIEGKPEYIAVSKLINQFPHVKVSAIVRMAGTNDKSIRFGKMDTGTIGRCRQICEWVTELWNFHVNDKPKWPWVEQRDFALALKAEVATQYHFQSLVRALKKDTVLAQERIGINGYRDMIQKLLDIGEE